MAIIQVNNANFYYELHGQGQPLILISGYACDHTVWLPVLDALSKRFQVLIFDNRGIGLTSDDGRTLSAELMAKDVLALAAALHLERPHIMGQSLGSTIAQMIALMAPEKIQKLLLVNTTAKWRQAMLCALMTQLLMRQNNIDMDLIIDTALPWFVGEKFLSKKTNIDLYKQMQRSNPNPQTVADQLRQFEALTEFDSRKHLPQITAETMVMYGIEDVISLPYEAKEVCAAIGGAKLQELPSAHVPMFECREQFLAAVDSFI